MSDYPPPSYAATVWTVGDRLVVRFPSPLDAPCHCVEFPNTTKGLALALATLREREQSSRSTIATHAAPSAYQVERALASDKKYNEWLNSMESAKAAKAAAAAEAEAFLKEIGLI